MAEVTLDQIPQRVRDMFNKGLIAFERKNFDFAIDLLSSCIEAEPLFHQARKFLRAAEIQLFRSKKSNAFSKMTSGMSSMPAYLTAVATLKSGKADQAMAQAEKLLRNDPLNLRYLTFFAQAAEASGMPEAAIQTLEVAKDCFPDDAEILMSLGNLYRDMGQTRLARDTFEKLCEVRPHDPVALKCLKDALARDSIAQDGWGKAKKNEGGYRDLLKNADETNKLEQSEKGTKTDKDVDVLILDAQSKIKAEPKNINYYRLLARLYSQRRLFDEAIVTLQKAMELNPGDPELDNAVSVARIAQFDFTIDNLTKAGDSETADVKKAERDQFVFDDLQERVKRYPNDLKLRYDLGLMLFENDYVNEAIQQLQLAQRSPKHRVESLFHLALCFKQKGQHDLALLQLENALADLPIMDDTKKNVLYELGEVAGSMGDNVKAAGYYKQIYSVDIGYKDIAEKVEKGYAKT